MLAVDEDAAAEVRDEGVHAGDGGWQVAVEDAKADLRLQGGPQVDDRLMGIGAAQVAEGQRIGAVGIGEGDVLQRPVQPVGERRDLLARLGKAAAEPEPVLRFLERFHEGQYPDLEMTQPR